jgi:hypothetical protein
LGAVQRRVWQHLSMTHNTCVVMPTHSLTCAARAVRSRAHLLLCCVGSRRRSTTSSHK